MTHRRAVLILLGCTFIWGASFTLNKLVLGAVSPLLFMAIRFAVSALMLAAVYPRTEPHDWRVGLRLGSLFALQLALFVVGLSRIDPARSAFLFSFQTPLVPVFVLVAHRQWPSRRDLVGVGVALVGAWFLTRPAEAGPGLGWGDLATIGSATCAALYVVLAGAATRGHDPVRLLAVQFVAMSGLAAVGAATVEATRFDLSPATVVLIGFLALSSIATFGGQLLGQQQIRPTEAALLYALEPLVAAAMSYLALGERLGPGQWLGGGLIVAASFLVAKRGGEPDRRREP